MGAPRPILAGIACALLGVLPAGAQPDVHRINARVAGVLALSAAAPEGSSVQVRPGEAAVIRLDGDVRFLRGIEVRVAAPPAWSAFHGSLAITGYADVAGAHGVRSPGVIDLAGRRFVSELLPGRVQSAFHIPVREGHELRSSPYATVPSGVVLPSSFPALFRLLPTAHGMGDELAAMGFTISARPILGAEGAVRFSVRYPDQLHGRPFSVLVNDVPVPDISADLILREGEHHLAVISEDYRNESRRFVVERARTVDLVINLQDPTPLIVFDVPAAAQIFLNDSPIFRGGDPIPVEPGVHEARIVFGGFSVTRTLVVQRGRTYRIALTVGVEVEESE